MTKLTDAQRNEIVRLVALNEPIKEVARTYSISTQTVYNCLRRKNITTIIRNARTEPAEKQPPPSPALFDDKETREIVAQKLAEAILRGELVVRRA